VTISACPCTSVNIQQGGTCQRTTHTANVTECCKTCSNDCSDVSTHGDVCINTDPRSRTDRTGSTHVSPTRTRPVGIWYWRWLDEHQSISVLAGLSCDKPGVTTIYYNPMEQLQWLCRTEAKNKGPCVSERKWQPQVNAFNAFEWSCPVHAVMLRLCSHRSSLVQSLVPHGNSMASVAVFGSHIIWRGVSQGVMRVKG